MAQHHHKSNAAVEGDPDTGHGRGMPKRPDEDELEARTELDRLEAGLPAEESGPSAAERGEEADEA